MQEAPNHEPGNVKERIYDKRSKHVGRSPRWKFRRGNGRDHLGFGNVGEGMYLDVVTREKNAVYGISKVTFGYISSRFTIISCTS